MLIDSHAHLSSDALIDDIDAVLERASNAGLAHVINICTDVKTLQRGLELAQRFAFLHNTGSTTPHDVEKEGEEAFAAFEQAARSRHLVAVGETGLDYYYTHSAKEIQKDFLRRYLHLALDCDLPVVIHCRDAFADFFDILDTEYTVDGRHAPGVLHCFTGTVAEAEEVIKRGWYLSLSGIVTFKRSQELREVARLVPAKQLLIETDSPYLAPQGHRGKRNEPSFLCATAAVVAQERGISADALAELTAENARKLFRI